MEVKTVSLSDVRPYHRNPRQHGNESIDSVKESITKFGFRVPIVLDKNNTLITGHARFKAAQDLEDNLTERIEELRDVGRDDLADNLEMVNLGELPVIYETELDGRTVDEYRISDNKIAEASEWDFEALEDELLELDTGNVVGYSEQQLEDLVDDFEASDDEDLDVDEEDESDPFGDTVGPVEDDEPTVDLICPDCLETVEVDAELALREFEVLSDNNTRTEPEVEAETSD